MPVAYGLILLLFLLFFTHLVSTVVCRIVSYMNGDIKSYSIIFIIGSAIPLVAYILWQISIRCYPTNTFMGIMAQQSRLMALPLFVMLLHLA